MIKINENMLIEDLFYTANVLGNNPNARFINNELSNFLVLNQSLLFNFGKMVLVGSEINGGYFEKVLQKCELQSLKQFIDYLNNNEEALVEISKNYNKITNDIGLSVYPFWDNIRRYSEKDFKDIILGFYSTYGNDFYKIVKKYFDEGRVHLGSLTDSLEYAGYFVGLQWLDSGYIFSIYDFLDSASASALVHELGHAIDAERFTFRQKKKNPLFSDCLLEVPSTVFEIGFNDYLKDNHIDIDGANILTNGRLNDMKAYFSVIEKSFEKDSLDVFPNGFACDEDNVEYDIRDSILYGLGYYFSLHLNLIKQSSNKDFLKVFNNLITLRKESTLEDAINNTGFTLDEFTSGKCIEPRLKKDLLELKKKYRY